MGTPDSAYRWGRTEALSADNLDKRFLDINHRLAPLEALNLAYEVLVGEVNDTVLAQVNRTIDALRVQLQRIALLQWLTGVSGSTVNLVEDTDSALLMADTDRDLFTPGPYAVLQRVSDPKTYAIVKSQSYDRDSGQFAFHILTVAGIPGSYSDWSVSAVAGSTIAGMVAEREARRARDEAKTAAASIGDSVQKAASSATAAATSATQAQRFASGSAFNALSASSITPVLGQVAAVLTPDTAEGFVLSAFVALVSQSDPSTTLLGRLVGFDPTTGTLTVNVYSFTGLNTRADWIITPTPPPYIPSGMDGGWADAPSPVPAGATPFFNAPVVFTGVSGGVDGGYAADGSSTDPTRIAFGGIGGGLSGTDGGYG